MKIRRGPINSPKAGVLKPLKVGDTLGVRVNSHGPRPVLEVFDTKTNAVAGSLTFVGYLELIGCIIDRQIGYKAVIINISGGIYEVRVEPV